MRGSPSVPVIVPKAELVGVLLGVAKLLWFQALYGSPLNRIFSLSRTGKSFTMEKSELL